MAHDIQVRKLRFPLDPGVPPVWNPTQREWSHMVNGASLAMPYLEPFLNHTLREASDQLDNADLAADVRGFIGQEAQHYTQHRRYNEMLKANGYPELAAVEATFAADYRALARRSLPWRLAYAAGFETMTAGITEWLLGDRDRLFRGADPTVTSLVLWHMVEETEHKTVAFDVFNAVSGNYLLRVLGLLHGSLHVGFMSRRAYVAMLKKDGCWHDLRSRLRLWSMVVRFLVRAGSAMVRALHPRHHPDQVEDPPWVRVWQRAYAGSGNTPAPMLDTSAPGIPPVFARGEHCNDR